MCGALSRIRWHMWTTHSVEIGTWNFVLLLQPHPRSHRRQLATRLPGGLPDAKHMSRPGPVGEGRLDSNHLTRLAHWCISLPEGGPDSKRISRSCPIGKGRLDLIHLARAAHCCIRLPEGVPGYKHLSHQPSRHFEFTAGVSAGL